MSGKRSLLGATSAAAGVLVALAVAVWLGWPVWIELRNRGWIPGVPPQPTKVEDQKVPEEPLDLPSAADVPQLVATLSHGDQDARRQALLQLSSIGPAAAAALPAIREQLQDESPSVRPAAVVALQRICRDPDVLIPLLAGMLDDESSGVAEVAARTLEEIGPRAMEAVMNVLRGDSRGRARAVLMLRRLMRPDNFAEVSKIIRGLRDDPDPAVRAEALMFGLETGQIGAAAINALLEFDYSSPAVHRSSNPALYGADMYRNSCDIALRAVTRQGPEVAEVVPAVMACFEKQVEIEPTFNHQRTLRQIGQPAPPNQLSQRIRLLLDAFRALKTAARPAIPHLMARVDETDPRIRPMVIGVLFDIGAEPEALTPPLTVQLAGPDHWQAHAAAASLVRVNPAEARRQVSLLIAKLEGPGQTVDSRPLSLLEGLGPEAREAVPLLIRLLSEGGGKYSHPAAAALGAIGSDAVPAVPALVQVIDQARRDGKMPPYGETPVETLGKIGSAANGALPVLLSLMNDPKLDPPAEQPPRGPDLAWFRARVMSALILIGPDSPEVLAAIRSQLKSPSAHLRAAAVYALACPASGSPDALSEIIGVMESDPVEYVRASSAIAIADMSGDRSAALDPLIEALRDADPNVRKAAATALGSMGVAAKTALPTLREIWIDALCGLASAPPESAPGLFGGVVDPWHRDRREFLSLSMAQVLLRAMMDIDPGRPVTP